MSDRDKAMNTLTWWQRGIIYEVYVLSFKDTDGDGRGDIPGILEKLDYLAWLGVDVIWLSPVYPSPMVDLGYDVTDYCGIHPAMGDIGVFDQLINEAHCRDIRVILDFVPNHTSDHHPWFQASRQSRDNDKRDWYIWHGPAEDGGPPNNWVSVFGGSAWTRDERTGEYYFHTFAAEQPELNLRNPAVIAELHAVLRFWMDRGVDGFRMDAAQRLIKDKEFRDNPENPDFKEGDAPDNVLISKYNANQSEVHDIISGFRKVIDGYGDRLLIGEMYLPIEEIMPYYGENLGGLHFPLNLRLLFLPWEAAVLADLARTYETSLPKGAWPNWAIGNHDRPRVASRLGPEQARTAAMALFTLRGTPFIYYGDEIGMTDADIPPSEAHDPQETNNPGKGFNRDAVRTPMQWNGEENAGFTTGEPWLPVAGNYSEINVDSESHEPLSMLSLYRQLIALRRAEPALIEGSWSLLAVDDGAIVYLRQLREVGFLITLNMTAEPATILLPEPNEGQIVLSTHLDRDGEAVRNEVSLRGHEGLIISLAPGGPPQ